MPSPIIQASLHLSNQLTSLQQIQDNFHEESHTHYFVSKKIAAIKKLLPLS